MKKHWVGLVLAGIMGILFAPTPVQAQDGGQCPANVLLAMARAGSACNGLEHDQACYGNGLIQAGENTFSAPGDKDRGGGAAAGSDRRRSVSLERLPHADSCRSRRDGRTQRHLAGFWRGHPGQSRAPCPCLDGFCDGSALHPLDSRRRWRHYQGTRAARYRDRQRAHPGWFLAARLRARLEPIGVGLDQYHNLRRDYF